MTPEALDDELAAGRIRPAYLLAGEEAFLRDRCLLAIRAAALGDHANDFDFERLDSERCDPAQLRGALSALPVLAPRRMVVLREPEARRARGAALGEALAAAVRELVAQSQTVFVVSAARIDKRSGWVRAFVEPAALVTCDPAKGTRAVAAFVSAEARRRGIALAAGAAEALADAAGPHGLRLVNELEKAALLAGPGERVGREHVIEAVSAVADDKVWELTDATFEGRRADALVALAHLLEVGVAAPVVLGALASHLRRLTRAREGEAIGGHPMAVKRIESQARRQPLARLLAGLRAAEQADERLKGLGSLPAERVLERLVLSLAG